MYIKEIKYIKGEEFYSFSINHNSLYNVTTPYTIPRKTEAIWFSETFHGTVYQILYNGKNEIVEIYLRD